MAKAIQTYVGGIHYLAQAAIREDGAIYTRVQNKTPYGYQWSKWKYKEMCDPNDLPETIPVGFNDLRRAVGFRQFKCRLPNS